MHSIDCQGCELSFMLSALFDNGQTDISLKMTVFHCNNQPFYIMPRTQYRNTTHRLPPFAIMCVMV